MKHVFFFRDRLMKERLLLIRLETKSYFGIISIKDSDTIPDYEGKRRVWDEWVAIFPGM